MGTVRHAQLQKRRAMKRATRVECKSEKFFLKNVADNLDLIQDLAEDQVAGSRETGRQKPPTLRRPPVRANH